MESINNVFLVALFIIILTWVAKHLGYIHEAAGFHVSKIIPNITLPSLALSTIPYIEFNYSLLHLPLIPLGHSLLMLLVGRNLFKDMNPNSGGMCCSSRMVTFSLNTFRVTISLSKNPDAIRRLDIIDEKILKYL